MTQTFTLLDYLRADKLNPWSMARKRALLRPVVQAATGEMTLEKWLAVAGAFNMLWLAKDEGLLVDEGNYVERTKAELADTARAKQNWLQLSNSVLVQYAHFLQEVPEATFIRLHRKMVQRTQKNVRSGRAHAEGDVHLGRRDFSDVSRRLEERG